LPICPNIMFPRNWGSPGSRSALGVRVLTLRFLLFDGRLMVAGLNVEDPDPADLVDEHPIEPGATGWAQVKLDGRTPLRQASRGR
jgi:hypothetical protein